ncbi:MULTISPECIES: RNase P modulator RnpM [Bacillus]|nr:MULTISPECIES: YlxR family protein [Bacillus]MBP1080053.1 putative RNA-binding protein YlxR (DUF448 family) [Bacillus capparidis]MED1095442.1 YlxR family protein [Bacillus capparidis]
MKSKKKIPLRKCIVTGEMMPKKELIRIVRSKEGDISVDPTGKKNGRGAYLTLTEESILTAQKKNILSKQFQTKIDDEIYDQLLELAKKGNNANG